MYFKNMVVLTLNLFAISLFGQQIPTASKKEIIDLTHQASNYLKASNFSKSLEISKIALQKAILSNDLTLTTVSYTTIAANYAALSQFDKAIFYYNKAMLYAYKTNSDTLKNKINNNLGNIYCFEKKQYLTGINYYNKAIKYSEKTADTTQIFMTHLNMAWAYFDIGYFDMGYPNLEYVNKHLLRYGNNSNVASINMLNGMYYAYQENKDEADSFFRKAIDLGNKTNQKSDLSFSHYQYSKYLFKIKDYKNAYKNLFRYNEIIDELYNREKLEKATMAGTNIELDEYKREIDKFEAEKKSNLQIVEKSKTIVLLFMILSIVLLLLLYILFRNNNYRRKSNSILSTTNKQLIIAKEKAEEASVLKSQFVSTISHELRTPLYGVVGITDILLDENKELANNCHLNSLKFSAKYLLSLVNDLLQINTIEDDKIILENFPFDITREINIIVKSLCFLSESNSNTITVKIDPKIPECLVGDTLKLSQIIMNLVSNALKFTQNGKVKIEVCIEKVIGISYFLEFKIEDNGRGIATADQEKIFENFVQVGRKSTDYQGTGLGLSIVKQLLTLFKTTISLQSELDKGTVFKFVIPFRYCSNQKIESQKDNLEKKDLNQIIKVLVVEDNHINQLVTRKTIEKKNYNCKVVDDGYAALELLDKEYFDVILMDINMPLIDGFETSKKIRAKGILTPIIALTAFNKTEISQQALAVGINDIIMKPYDSDKLFVSITALIFKA